MIAQFLESRGFSPRSSRLQVLTLAAGLLVIVIILEGTTDLDYSLGVLYAVPVVVGATVMNWWPTLLLALFCAWVRGLFTSGFPPVEFWLRFAMATLAYGGVGMLVSEMSRNRRAILAAYAKLRLSEDLRKRAEDQLRTLVESSPAAIMTLNHKAEVLAANRAAHEVLRIKGDSLIGMNVASFIPAFAGALRVKTKGAPMRVSSTTWAKRADGAQFPASVWFSTYEEDGERRVAGILVDTSEEVREREHETFRHLLDSNRLLAGAVAHEIRNLCSAVRVVSSNLRRYPEIESDADFKALNTLVESLGRIASFELNLNKDRTATRVDLSAVLEELRVVIEPDWADVDGTIEWQIPGVMPYVHADSHGLLQVFLNLSQNSLRAVKKGGSANLCITCAVENGVARLSFRDEGPGIEDTKSLFQPFRDDADGSGLGLYVSRAILRGFGGEINYVPAERGCQFDILLPTYQKAAEQAL